MFQSMENNHKMIKSGIEIFSDHPVSEFKFILICQLPCMVHGVLFGTGEPVYVQEAGNKLGEACGGLYP